MKLGLVGFIAALCMLLMSTQALAAPEKLYLSGTFDDGGSFSGYYLYDQATYSYAEVNITTTGGTLPDATYVQIDPGINEGQWVAAWTSAGGAKGNRVLVLRAATGGTSRAFRLTNGYCLNEGCSFTDEKRSALGYATFYPPSIPTLTQWAMILMGAVLASLALLSIRRRDRRA